MIEVFDNYLSPQAHQKISDFLDDGYWSDELTTSKEKKTIKKLGYCGGQR